MPTNFILMKLNILYFIGILISSQLLAQQRNFNQQPVNLSGKIVDSQTKKGLGYATIVLTNLRNNAITGDVTNDNGEFSIRAKKGRYDIEIEFISFEKVYIKNKLLTENTDLGTIFLRPSSESLDEVEVVAKKSTVEIQLDKKIYNVGSDMTVKGGTAADVLDNVPSVTVDAEGNVSLRGNSNVRILVNGKPSGLVGLSGTDALRQLAADAIEKVEVITSPSARYDAEGTAGILNIVLSKGKAIGFNGSTTVTAGNPDYFGGSANLNFRTKKINLFTNSSYNYRKSPGNSFNNVTYFDDSGTISSYTNDIRNYDRQNKRFNSIFGLEYYLSKNTSITGTVVYRNSKDKDISINESTDLDSNFEALLTNIRTEDENEKDKTIEYSLNFTKDFKTDGHRLSFDFQYGENEEFSDAFISDRDILPVLIENDPEKNSTDESSKTVLLQGDYVLPIGENMQFELGFKADLNEQYSDYLVEEFDENSGFIRNEDFSNTLIFEENIYAAYTQFGKKINKFSYLLGLRMEVTDLIINLIGTNQDFSKRYSQLFPTVNLGYEFSKSESLTLGYGRRVRRPRSWFLNPFESRLSETYIRTGNVDLDPTYTNSYDLGYLKRWKKFTLNTSLYFQRSINSFEFVQTEETREVDGIPTLVIIRYPINLSSLDRYGFEFTANYNPFKWWRISNNFNFFRFVTKGAYDGISYDSDDISWFNRINSQLTLPGKIEFQTIAFYRGPQERAQTTRKGILSVNLALSKDILKNNGTLSLNVSDVFNSRKRKSIDYTPTTVTESEFQWRERQLLLNFIYRFNEKKKRGRQQRNYDNGDEGEMF